MQFSTFFCLFQPIRLGTFGYMAEYGAEKKISKYSSVVASVSVGQPTGVIMKIKYVHIGSSANHKTSGIIWRFCSQLQADPIDAVVHFSRTLERGHYTGGRILCNHNANRRMDCPEKGDHRAHELGAKATGHRQSEGGQ